MRVGDGGRREEGSHAPSLVRRPKSQGSAGRQPVSNPGCSVPFAAPCCLIRLKSGWWLRAGQGRAASGTKRGECLPPGILRSKPPTPCAERRVSTPASRNKDISHSTAGRLGDAKPAVPRRPSIWGSQDTPAKPRTREGGGIWGVVGMLCQIEQPNPLLLRSDAASHRVSKDEGSSRLGGRGQRALVLRDADPRGPAPQDEGVEHEGVELGVTARVPPSPSSRPERSAEPGSRRDGSAPGSRVISGMTERGGCGR